MNEYKLLRLAVAEVWPHNTPRRAEERAEELLIGGIGQIADTREKFIAAGLRYLDQINETAALAIETVKADYEEPDLELIQAINCLVAEAGRVDRTKFAKELAADWDERHGDDNNN